MRIKNLTPFPVGYKVTSRRPPTPEMMLVVRGKFSLVDGGAVQPILDPPVLGQGALTADVFADDDDEQRGEPRYPSDFADWKPRADIMLRGTCHAPGGRPAPVVPVKLEVGRFQKHLRIVGHREWVSRLAGSWSMTDPVPFVAMPIDYAHAFGGAGHAQNPVGVGLTGDALPTVELASAAVTNRQDRPAPGGFGPIGPNWPERVEKRGREYGAAYQKTRAPFYSEDFEWSYFQAAPADQQVDYLSGDENVVLQNLMKDAPIFSTRLPAMRVRAFVVDDRGDAREVSLSLDTLFIDTDERVLYLAWRGLVPARTLELSDITYGLVVSESMKDAPLTEDHYRAILLDFARDPIGLEEAMAKVLAEQGMVDDSPAPAPKDPVSAKIAASIPKGAKGIEQPLMTMLGGLENRPHTDQARVALEKAIANDVRREPPPIPPAPGAPPKVAFADSLKSIAGMVESLKKTPDPTGEKRAIIAKLEAMLSDPRLSAIDPSLRAAKEGGQDPPGPRADLRFRDLSSADLRGLDLSGANLEGANLSSATLSSVCLAGANLRGAVVFEAELSGADLSGCDLSGANFASAVLAGAKLTGAKLQQTHFGKANLRGADLSSVDGADGFFPQADLTKATLVRAKLSDCDFEEATLTGARLDGASLLHCIFMGASADEASFTNASVSRSTFQKARLKDASFASAVAEDTQFAEALLTRANFELAILTRAHLQDARAKGARFVGANLRDAVLARMDLEGAHFGSANLMSADLSQANVRGALFRRANLYDAKLLRVEHKSSADFSEANMKRVVAGA